MSATTVPQISTLLILIFFISTTNATTFTFINKCAFTIWPAILSNSNSPPLDTTGFELPSSSSRSLLAPSSWSGRFWARTNCSQLSPSLFSCSSADCNSNQIPCNGNGASPPVTLAEFTLSPSSLDFYDVSLVDGYNLPLLIQPSAADCGVTGCVEDLGLSCPGELKSAGGCRSACEAFKKDEYCCSGGFASPNVCRPSVYSQVFKSVCPKSYSYAFDDPTSTFTCRGGADYALVFCPVSSPSQKSSTDSPTFSSSTPTFSTPTTPATPTTATSATMTPTATGGVMLQDESWLASLATGESTAARLTASVLHQTLLIGAIIACSLFLLVL